MSSIYSNHSTPKCQSKKGSSLDKIHHKAITKQKKYTTQTMKKQEQSLILASQNKRKLRQQTYIISQIKSIDQSISSIRVKPIPLGRLFIDEFTMNNKILERKITSEFVECKLSPTNFYDEENGLQKKLSYYHELSQLYNSFPVQAQGLEERKSFEDSLNCPYERITLSSLNNKLIKISKKWNYDFLRMMGINQIIIDDYIFNHNLLPKCWDFMKIFSKNGEAHFTTNIINYQGEKFITNMKIKTFIEQNKSTSIREQVTYVQFQCGRQFLNVEKVQANFLDYFNLKELTPDLYLSIHQTRIAKRCSFRKKTNQDNR
ncbi:unnamed protein product [Paramecium sonneborni]|uniref:Uncharacterized protein n=1 Tax=Paramecium sonneborni TaxID=65129 RepID=A0A8S1JWE0_9CILI|nr:unnamed protein product [Paramecium sonneborni]